MKCNMKKNSKIKDNVFCQNKILHTNNILKILGSYSCNIIESYVKIIKF